MDTKQIIALIIWSFWMIYLGCYIPEMFQDSFKFARIRSSFGLLLLVASAILFLFA